MQDILEMISTPKKLNLDVWMVVFHHKLAEERTFISLKNPLSHSNREILGNKILELSPGLDADHFWR